MLVQKKVPTTKEGSRGLKGKDREILNLSESLCMPRMETPYTIQLKKMNRNAHLSPHLLEEEDSRCRKPCVIAVVRPACGQGKLPAMDAPPMHYGTGCTASPTLLLPGSGVRNSPGLRRAGSRDTSRRSVASSVIKPWYTSRTNSYMVSGASMGQADKDVLKVGGSTKDFSHVGAVTVSFEAFFGHKTLMYKMKVVFTIFNNSIRIMCSCITCMVQYCVCIVMYFSDSVL